jgi:tRNA(fMet)-specific endonuclease VapC
MPLYLLDTDHISLIQRGHPQVIARYEAVPEQDIAVSVIGYEEQLRGRLAVIGQVKTPEHLSLAYQRVREMQEFFCQMRLLDFDVDANRIYTTLRQQHRRLGTMDLRIAATALAAQSTLVTRNTQDFSPISGLSLDNWA